MQKTILLHVDEAVLQKANQYAEATGKKLPDVLEEYVTRLAEVAGAGPLSPRIQRLYGALRLPEGLKDEDVLTDALLSKYLP